MEKNKSLIKSFEEINKYASSKKLLTKNDIKDYLNHEDKGK